MAGEFYDHTTYPATGASGSSSAMRAELESIQTGFDKLAGLSGNGGKIIAVNAGATAYEALTTTGTGSAVRATSPTLVTPALGAATATSINGLTITTSTGTLTVTDGKTAAIANSLTFTGTDGSSVAFGAGGTVAYLAMTLAVFAATTSAQLAGVISDETGSGALVFATSPTLVTPNIGAATAAAFTATGDTLLAGSAGTQAARFVANASNVNYHNIRGGTVGNGVTLGIIGTDSVVDFNIEAKSTGLIKLYSGAAINLAVGGVLEPLSYLKIAGGLTGAAVTLVAVSSESNTSITITPKGSGTLNTAAQIVTTIATGTAPFAVSSTTNVANLNASSLSGATFAAPGAIGSGTPAAGSFTTLSATTAPFDISGGSAGQIKFPATQNASSNANTLDDYEEGSFTPTFGYVSGVNPTVNHTTQIGRYTKIGNKVTVWFDVEADSIVGGTSGTCLVAGLPFTSASSAVYPVGAFRVATALANGAAGQTVRSRIDPSEARVLMEYMNTGASGNAGSAASTFNASGRINGTLTYYV